MSITPLITFKAGLCDIEAAKPMKVCPRTVPGYLYVYFDENMDGLPKLCWRQRVTGPDDPELELLIPPADANFIPYEGNPIHPTSKPHGRFFVLKFRSSSIRQFFWLQSKPRRANNPSWFSPRDRKLGNIVDRLLQGENVDVAYELAPTRDDDGHGGNADDDGDETMEDLEPSRSQRDPGAGRTGGAGADATGGDVREEGETSREGGADGARAGPSSAIDADAQQVIRNFLQSLQGNAPAGAAQRGGYATKPYPNLTHLLASSTTTPMIEAASEEYIDALIGLLPPTVVVLATGAALDEDATKEPTPDAAQAALDSLVLSEKRSLLKRVLRSPQFHQSLASLSQALRDGGLPNVAGALGIKLDNRGRLPGAIPLGGGEALEAFLEGVKKSVQEKRTTSGS